MRRDTAYTLMLAIVVAAALGLSAVSIIIVAKTSSNCVKITKLYQVLHTITAASAAQLGAPGQSGYSYYRSHPAELAAARAGALKVTAALVPPPCR